MSNIVIFVGSVVGGGVSKITTTLQKELEKYIGIELVQIVKKDGKSFNPPISHSLIASSEKLAEKRWYRFPISLIRFVKLCYNNKIKLVLTMDAFTGVVSIISSFIHKHKTIVSIHAMPSFPETQIDSYMRKILYQLIRITKTPVIAVSKGVEDELVSLCHIHRKQITVIYNPMDLETTRKDGGEDVDLPKPLQNTKEPILITVGRLVDIKGQDHLIRIFAELQKTNPSYLMILGTGPNEQYLRELTEKYSLNERVFFMGWQENPYKYIAHSKLLVHTSLSESFGNVLVEAMTLGCPVVTTRCSPSIEEVMGAENSCGFITKEMSKIKYSETEPLDESESEFLSKIQTILDNPELYNNMSQASRERAKRFDVDVGIQKYLELIERFNN